MNRQLYLVLFLQVMLCVSNINHAQTCSNTVCVNFQTGNSPTVDGAVDANLYTHITETPFAAPLTGGSSSNSDFVGESANNQVYTDGTGGFLHSDGSTDIQQFRLTYDANNLYLIIEGPSAFQSTPFDQMDLFVAIDTDNTTGTGEILTNTQVPYAKRVDFAGWSPEYFVAIERVEFGNDYASFHPAGGAATASDTGFNTGATGFQVGYTNAITEIQIPWTLLGGAPNIYTGTTFNFAVYTTYDGDNYDVHDSAPGVGNGTVYEEIGDLPYDADYCSWGNNINDPVLNALDAGCNNCEADGNYGPGDDDNGFGGDCGNKSPASDNTTGDVDTIEEYFQISNIGQLETVQVTSLTNQNICFAETITLSDLNPTVSPDCGAFAWYADAAGAPDVASPIATATTASTYMAGTQTLWAVYESTYGNNTCFSDAASLALTVTNDIGLTAAAQCFSDAALATPAATGQFYVHVTNANTPVSINATNGTSEDVTGVNYTTGTVVLGPFSQANGAITLSATDATPCTQSLNINALTCASCATNAGTFPW